MIQMHHLRKLFERATLSACVAGLVLNPIAASAQSATAASIAAHPQTATPIKHVIVLIGENRTFDHLFATYVPQSQRFRLEPACPKGSSMPTAHPARISPKAAAVPGDCSVPNRNIFISLNRERKGSLQDPARSRP